MSVLTAKELKQKSLRIKKNCFHFTASLMYSSKRFRASLLNQFDVLFTSLQSIGSGMGHSVEVLEAFLSLKLEIYASLHRWCEDFQIEHPVLKLWKGKINSLQKKRETESEKEKELRVKKYIVIFKRNNEELEELRPIVRESEKIINNAIEVGIEGRTQETEEQDEGPEEIKVQSKIEIEQPALLDSVSDQKKMLQRRVEPLLKLFHDQTFTLLHLLRRGDQKAGLQEKTVEGFLQILNDLLMKSEELKRKADRLGSKGAEEEQDEDELLFKLYSKSGRN